MALTLPTSDDFVSFFGDDASDIDEDRIDLLIELSASLLWLATGIDSDPDDSRLSLLVKYAILDMAVYLSVSRDNITEAYNPYQSEKIGSYSYSKIFTRVQRNIGMNESTGVMFFDKVVEYLLDSAMYGSCGSLSTENVFQRGYQPLFVASFGFSRLFKYQDPNLDRRTIYSFFGNADDDQGIYLQ